MVRSRHEKVVVLMKILLSAFACEPGGGSEPGIGWDWATELARIADVVVLTDGSFRSTIEAELERVPRPNMSFVYLGRGPRGYEGLSVYPYYAAWQRRALQIARGLHDLHDFDVAHHLTYGMHRMPSWLWRLPIPFIWGPIGGGEDVPAAFYSPRHLGAKESSKEVVRRIWNLVCPVDPRLRSIARNAKVTAVTTEQTRQAFPVDARGRMIVMPRRGLAAEDLEVLGRLRRPPPPPTGMSAAFVGRLLGWKGPSYALEAFRDYAVTHPDATLHFYGSGPAQPRLERMAAPLGAQVIFHGPLSRAALLQRYAAHHALLFPSLHDSYPQVALEAMAAGLPVVCFEAGGLSLSVPAAAGIKVPVTTPAAGIRDLAAGLRRLTASPEVWQQMSDQARAHVYEGEGAPSTGELVMRLYGAAGLIEATHATSAAS